MNYQYDYEQEEITTTARPVQAPSRPKYTAPAYQFPSSPAPQQRFNAIDIIYADSRGAIPAVSQNSAPNVKSHFQIFDDRRPAQFPQQEQEQRAVAPTPISRADEYALFAPASADSRGDVYKPKVRYPLSLTQRRRKKRTRKNVFIVLRKKRTFIF